MWIKNVFSTTTICSISIRYSSFQIKQSTQNKKLKYVKITMLNPEFQPRACNIINLYIGIKAQGSFLYFASSINCINMSLKFQQVSIVIFSKIERNNNNQIISNIWLNKTKSAVSLCGIGFSSSYKCSFSRKKSSE